MIGDGTVREFAAHTFTIPMIERAISFDARLARCWTVPVVWHYALKNSAGRANEHKIWLHPGLKEEGEEALRSTFLHELAHTHAATLYGREGYGHSRAWWEAMIRLAEQPWNNRRHNYSACKSRVAVEIDFASMFKKEHK